MPRKIVVAVEGSPPSLNAAAYGAELAALTNARLVYLYVVLLPQYIPEGVRKRVSEELSSRGKNVLRQVAEAAKEKRVKSSGKVLLTTSSIVSSICEFAEGESADIIVLGTRTGTSAVSKAMLGSVASGVANNAHCAVLVIR